MNRSPDVELVLRDYFADDSWTAPDHVLDVIEERIMRQPQQRAWRVSWRDSHVNSYLKPLLAVAAIVVVAVAGFAILRPPGTGVGGPPATASAGPTAAFGGTVQYQGDGAPVTTEVDAVASGATVTGTAVTTFRRGTHTVRLGCVARDGDTWALGGTVEQSTLPGEPVGAWSRVMVKDGSPQRIAIWLSYDVPTGSDCLGSLALFGGAAALAADDFVAVESGALVPPPDPAP